MGPAAMDANKKKVLLFPWLAYGHISPFLELGKRLTKLKFQVYLCSSPVNLEAIKPKICDSEECFSSIVELIELHLPSSPELPSHMHTTKGIPLHLEHTLMKTLDKTAPYFLTILQKYKPDLVISDSFQPWAAQLASTLNIPTVLFYVTGISVFVHIFHEHFCIDDEEFPHPEVDLTGHWIKKTPVTDFSMDCGIRIFQSLDRSSKILLVNTSTVLEENYINYISKKLKQRVIPIGPMIPKLKPDNDHDEKSEIIDWLHNKTPKSTVYVSFGSEFYLSKEDRAELAHGLELSGVNFVWIIRFPKGEEMEIEEALPEGFLERVNERGVVINSWAPQLKILNHSSIGGFVCHCGWNSAVESIMFGIPIIALPMHLEQPWHARVMKLAGVGVEVKRDDEGKILREEVAKSIREVILDEKKREIMSLKAREISDFWKEKEGETMSELAVELLKLCEEEN